MAVEYTQGNILDSDCDLIVCPTNTVGVMGAGLAKTCRDAFPGLFEAYQAACRNDTHTTKQAIIIDRVACVASKQHWRNPSQLSYVEQGLRSLKQQLTGRSVAIPRIGCGLGGLDWITVRNLIEDIFHDAPERIVIYQ